MADYSETKKTLEKKGFKKLKEKNSLLDCKTTFKDSSGKIVIVKWRIGGYVLDVV